MSGARKVTEADEPMIVSMREAGSSYVAIAAALGRGISAETIHWHCLRLAVDPPNPPKPWTEIKGPVVQRRGNHLVRRFTAEDDARLLELEAEGLNDTQIGRKMDRKPNSIKGRLMTLARRDRLMEDAA